MSESATIGFTDDDRVFVGEDKIIAYNTKNAAGTPQDLTGFELEWVLRTGPEGAALLTKTSGASEITIANGAGTLDQARVQLEDTDTVDGGGAILIAAGHYYHTLRRTNSGDEQVLSYGEFLLSVPATR